MSFQADKTTAFFLNYTVQRNLSFKFSNPVHYLMNQCLLILFHNRINTNRLKIIIQVNRARQQIKDMCRIFYFNRNRDESMLFLLICHFFSLSFINTQIHVYYIGCDYLCLLSRTIWNRYSIWKPNLLRNQRNFSVSEAYEEKHFCEISNTCLNHISVYLIYI